VREAFDAPSIAVAVTVTMVPSGTLRETPKLIGSLELVVAVVNVVSIRRRDGAGHAHADGLDAEVVADGDGRRRSSCRTCCRA
jgi:hypothetical protein